MKSVWKYIVAQQGLFYKSLLILSSSVLILYIFPLGGQFKYEFQKGRVWQYPDFYSPFDFSILKSEAEVKKDESTALKNLKLYLRADETIKNQVYSKYAETFIGFFQDQQNPMVLDSLYDFGKQLLDEVYFYGVLPPNYVHQGNPEILLIQGQTEIPILVNKFFKPEKLFEFIGSRIVSSSYVPFEDMYKDLFFQLIVPNVSLDKNFYETAKAQVLQNISRSRGFIPSGKLIVAEGALVDEETFEILNSLRKERVPVAIYLVNGIKLQGQIESFDQFVILLKNTVSQMVYKHAVSTVVPARSIAMAPHEE